MSVFTKQKLAFLVVYIKVEFKFQKKYKKVRPGEILLISLKQICLNERREIQLHTNRPRRRLSANTPALGYDVQD